MGSTYGGTGSFSRGTVNVIWDPIVGARDRFLGWGGGLRWDPVTRCRFLEAQYDERTRHCYKSIGALL